MHAGNAIGSYTAQSNAHGNIIVCKGTEVRNSYHVVFSGGYHACLRFKVAHTLGQGV